MFGKMLHDERGKLLIFVFFMSLVSVIQVAFWPTFREMLPRISEFFPDFMQWMVGGITEEGFIFYVITQQLIKNIGISGSALAVLLGASAIAKEREAGTLELLLAQPISRTRVLAEKFVFNAAVLAVPILVSTMLVWPAAIAVGDEIDPTALLVSAVYCYTIFVAIFAFTFAVGVVVDEQMRVISYGLGACLLMMILIIYEETKPYSIYGYLDVEILRPVFAAGRIPYWETLAFATLSAGFFVASLLLFRKKTI